MKEEKRKREHRDEESERKEWTCERERRHNLWRKVNCHMLVAETIGPSA